MGKKKTILKQDGTEDFDAEALEPDEVDTDVAKKDEDAGVPSAFGIDELPGDEPKADAEPKDVDKADDQPHDILTEDKNGANPTDTDGGELAAAAKPPAEVPEQDPVGTAVQGTALAEGEDAGAHTGDVGITTPNPEPAAAAAPEATESSASTGSDEGKPAGDAPVFSEAPPVGSGVEAPKPEADAATTGADTASATTSASSEAAGDEGKSDAGSTSSSASAPSDSSSSADAEPAMPVLGGVHPEAAPIAEAAGNDTMDKFKDAGNLLTEGLQSLREIEHKLEELSDEAKARLSHLRTKGSEVLAALEAWFSRE